MSETKTQDAPAPHRDVVDVSAMKTIAVRPDILSYIRTLWQLRHFIHEQSQGKAHASSRGTVLGRMWILLEPFINAAIYVVVFGWILKSDRGIENFVGFIITGSLVFRYFRASLSGAASVISSGANLINSFTFPRATLVFSFAETLLLNTLPAYAFLLVVIMVVGDHAMPTVYWLLFPVAILMQIPFNIGLSFVTASLTARIPDLKFIWTLVGMFWFYGSGVFFTVSRFVRHPAVAAAMEANPAYVLMTMCRDLLLYRTVPGLDMWLYFLVWSIGLFVVGFVLFWLDEENYGVKNDR